MEIKFDIEASQLDDTVVDIFKNLSPEQRESLALTVLREWLVDPNTIEFRSKADIVIQEMRVEKAKIFHECFVTDETSDKTIEQSSEFKKRLQGFRSSKDIVIADIKESVLQYYKQHIQSEIENDPRIKAILDETYDVLAKNMPNIVVDAMTAAFVKNIANMTSAIQDTMISTMRNTGEINRLLNNQ